VIPQRPLFFFALDFFALALAGLGSFACLADFFAALLAGGFSGASGIAAAIGFAGASGFAGPAAFSASFFICSYRANCASRIARS